MATDSRQADSTSTPDPNAEVTQNRPDQSDGLDLPNTELTKKTARNRQDSGERFEVPANGNAQPFSKSLSQTDEVATDEAQGRSLTTSPSEELNGNADQFFTLSKRIPIQVFNEETRLQKLAHWGPVVTGVASLVLTAFVWVNTERLTKRQVDIQAKQLELQNQQVEADMRFKFIADITGTDGAKKTSAEITLAQNGMEAFPVVHYALGVEQEDVRKSALNVVYRLFQSETNANRDELLRKLMEEFRSPNKTLHTGIVQSFVKIESLMNEEQRRNVIGFLQQNIAPENACLVQDGREVVFEAAKFVGSKRRDAIPYLLTITNVPRCGDGWQQAMYNLRTFALDMSPEEKSDLRGKIEQIRKDVVGHLDQKISKEELAEGAGFIGSAKETEVGMTFEAFKKRVEEQFDTLISLLG